MKRSMAGLIIAGLVVGAVGCGAVGQPAATARPAPRAIEEQEREVTLERIQRQPERFYGREVTVTGHIDERVGTSAVTLVSSRLMDTDEVLAIGLSLAEIQEAEAERVPLEVAGEVRRFDAAELERGFGLQLEEEVYDAFEGEPVVVAASVRALTMEEAFGEGEATLRLVAERPDEYADRRVAVSGTVAEVLTERAFAVAGTAYPTDGRVLMITRSADVMERPLEVDDLVAVRGTVGVFQDGDLESDLDLDLSGGVYEGYEGAAVVVVDTAVVMTAEQAGRVRRQFVVRPANISDERMLRAILQAPDEYEGRWTKVVGKVGTRVGNRSFALVGATLPADGELLVIDVFEEPVTPLERDVPVLVAGEVRPFAPGELGEELDLDLSDSAFEQAAGGPVMVADVLRIIPDLRLRELEEAALETIAAGPGDYAGGQATVRGTVSEVLDDGSITVSSPGLGRDASVLVMMLEGTDAPTSAEEGDLVTVSGTVHRFDPDETGEMLGRELSDSTYGVLEGHAVIVADLVMVGGEE